jgi:Ala-tRNA(Pro) deacylase
MSIPDKVLSHLEQSGVTYSRVSHPHTDTSQQTAEVAHVSGDTLAKGVLLQKEDGAYLLAVLPASHTVYYPELETRFGTRVQPAEHEALRAWFPDCETGAIPPFGMIYGLDTVVDEALLDHDPVYFEAGDHKDVVGVSAFDFRSLLFGADFFSFSRRSHGGQP